MKQPGIISDGAKKRLFKMAIKANARLADCVGESDADYAAAKARSDQWNEIIMATGLTREFKAYLAERNHDES